MALRADAKQRHIESRRRITEEFSQIGVIRCGSFLRGRQICRNRVYVSRRNGYVGQQSLASHSIIAERIVGADESLVTPEDEDLIPGSLRSIFLVLRPEP